MTVPLPPPLPWDLDRLSAEALEAAYADMAAFVTWLRDAGADVPACWHVHRHVVHRLAAVMWWRAAAYEGPTEDDHGQLRGGAVASAAAEWWASNSGLAGWLAAFRELPCKGRPGGHRDDGSLDNPAASFRESVLAHLRSLASRRDTGQSEEGST
jgi:hypothetical protein